MTVHTDHKPLETLMKKEVKDSVNKRIQQTLLKLQRYSVNAKHVPGQELWIADTLSRQLSTSSCKPCGLAIKLAKQTLVTDLVMAPKQLRE